jgi:hypothetical protein
MMVLLILVLHGLRKRIRSRGILERIDDLGLEVGIEQLGLLRSEVSILVGVGVGVPLRNGARLVVVVHNRVFFPI